MGLRSFLRSASRVLRTTVKPDREALMLSIKICIIGVLVLGGIGFLVRLVSITFQPYMR